MVVGLGSIAMSSANSSTYVFDDWWDAERDRLHTNKKSDQLPLGAFPVE